jgi:hypothetical protein
MIRKSSIIAFLVFFFVSQSFSQKFELISPPILDLGSVTEDSIAHGTIEFMNGGDSTLIIGGIQTSCGCTVADLKKREYAPGEKGEINVQFNTRGYTGMARKSVMISIDQGSPARVRVELQTNVIPLLEIDPSFVNFQDATLGNKKIHRNLKLQNNYPDSLKVTDIETNIAGLEISPRSFVLKPGAYLDVDLSFLPKKEQRINGYIDVKVVGPVSRFKRIPVFISVNP